MKFSFGTKSTYFIYNCFYFEKEAILNLENEKEKDFSTFFYPKIQAAKIKKLESSLAFGFYIKNQNEFDNFYDYLENGNNFVENFPIGIQNRFIDAVYEETDPDILLKNLQEENKHLSEESKIIFNKEKDFEEEFEIINSLNFE